MSGQLPPGYQRHPNNPNYIWNPSTNDVRAMPMEQPPPPVMPPAQAPVQVSMPEQTWGQQDLSTSVFLAKRTKKLSCRDFFRHGVALNAKPISSHSVIGCTRG